MYEIPSIKGKKEVIVTRKVVEGAERPIINLEDKKKTA
jgi:ATP-dependent protease Clp ATPase subunit